MQGKDSDILSIASKISSIHQELLTIHNQLPTDITSNANVYGEIRSVERELDALGDDVARTGSFLGQTYFKYRDSEELLVNHADELLDKSDLVYSKDGVLQRVKKEDEKKKSGFFDWIGSGIESSIEHIGDFFNGVGEAVDDLKEGVDNFFQDANEFLNDQFERGIAYSTEMYLKARDSWNSWADSVGDFFQENWDGLKEWASGVEWGEVGIGALQMIGGVLEGFAGLAIATATSATGIGIAGGVYMCVDGASNALGGFTKLMNGLKGNKEGDTWNFMKAGYKKLSSIVGFDETYGEMFYNGTQLVIGLCSLGAGLKELPKAAVGITKTLAGSMRVANGAKTWGYFAREGAAIGRFVYTQSGLLVKSTQIYLDKLALGLSLIGVDVFNLSTLAPSSDDEDDETLIDERNIVFE